MLHLVDVHSKTSASPPGIRSQKSFLTSSTTSSTNLQNYDLATILLLQESLYQTDGYFNLAQLIWLLAFQTSACLWRSDLLNPLIDHHLRRLGMKKQDRDSWLSWKFFIKNLYNILIISGAVFCCCLVGNVLFRRAVSVDSYLRWGIANL